MKKNKLILVMAVVAGVLGAGNLFAINLGTDITIPDKDGFGTGNWWGTQEDNEVTPGVQLKGQAFDLEGFISDKSILSIVGGYNFLSPPADYMDPGDLFIAIEGVGVTPTYGTATGDGGTTAERNRWGYDYVFDMHYAQGTYTLYRINNYSLVRNVYYEANRTANPWRYHSGGWEIGTGAINFLHLSSYDLRNYGYIGDANNQNHYVAQVDLSLLPAGVNFWAHYTMECGNDNLMGYDSTNIVPDGGATLALLGGALLGMVALGRRFRNGV